MELDSVLSDMVGALIGPSSRGLKVVATVDELCEAVLFHCGCSLFNRTLALVFPVVGDVI